MKFEPRPHSRSVDEGVIPLVNVVFLLLLFFVLTGTLVPPEPLQVSPPESSSGAHLAREEVVMLLSADGRIAMRGEEVPVEDFGEVIANRFAIEPSSVVHLRADRSVEARVLLDVLDVLRDVGIERVVLQTEMMAGS
ncbi:MAG: biopolymer transporter ExbD [bacterium]|nr:biopolymer transporter ExbD [bacterium]MCP5068266.1 biopolymer transporter ExbD [bacterium]